MPTAAGVDARAEASGGLSGHYPHDVAQVEGIACQRGCPQRDPLQVTRDLERPAWVRGDQHVVPGAYGQQPVGAELEPEAPLVEDGVVP